MAHLVKPVFVRWIDPQTGKRIPKGSPGAEKVKERSAKYYGAGIPGQGKKRFPLAVDKRVAEKMLNDLVSDAERGLELMPARGDSGRPLGPLAAEFEQTVARKAKPKHATAVAVNVRRVLDGCELTALSDLYANDLVARVERFVWSLTEGDDAVSLPTAAYVGKHVHGFTRWLWRKRKLLQYDPLAGLDLPSQETQQHRRALSVEELAALVETAERSPRRVRSLDGPDRAVLYLVAVATGYRSGELAKLTPDHFDLDADVPVIRLKGKHTKNKKTAEQPLPPGVATRLREYLKGRAADQPVWPGAWRKRSADMMRFDLRAANIPLTVDDEHALFHSLRHTYTTLLARSAPVKVTQELARHSTPVLTIGRYSHTSLREKAEAVARLPLPGSGNAGGVFSGLTRAELEATAEVLLVAVAALAAPPAAPKLDSGRDGGETGEDRRRETAAPGRRPKSLKKQGVATV